MTATNTGNGLRLEKARYTHEGMIDLIVANPMVTQRELAAAFGYTEGWISQILRSDALRELLAKRRAELIDPVVIQSFEKRLESLAHQSLEVLSENLQLHRSSDTALKALEISSRAMGYGAKAPGVQINQSFVAYMPQKSTSPEAWIEQYTKPNVTIDTIIDVPQGA
jgi:hypothetical protein